MAKGRTHKIVKWSASSDVSWSGTYLRTFTQESCSFHNREWRTINPRRCLKVNLEHLLILIWLGNSEATKRINYFHFMQTARYLISDFWQILLYEWSEQVFHYWLIWAERSFVMLYTIAVILLVLWLLGMVSSYTMGGFIHTLLVIAIVVVLIQVISGRRSL